MKDRKIEELENQLTIQEGREKALKFTNKKLASVAHRNQNEIMDLQRRNLTLDKQNKYLQDRLDLLLDQIDPEKALTFKKDMKRGM